KIRTIQRRRLVWPLHKDDTLSQSGRPTDLDYFYHFLRFLLCESSSTPTLSQIPFISTLFV
ncbi:hypothetical protein BGW80DRAFT_1209580, partial [Lactifluus volemus]